MSVRLKKTAILNVNLKKTNQNENTEETVLMLNSQKVKKNFLEIVIQKRQIVVLIAKQRKNLNLKKMIKNLARKSLLKIKRNHSAIKNLLMTKIKNLVVKRNLVLIKSLEVATKVLMRNILIRNLALKRNLEVTDQTDTINLLKTAQNQELQPDHANHNLIKNPLQNRYFIAI